MTLDYIPPAAAAAAGIVPAISVTQQTVSTATWVQNPIAKPTALHVIFNGGVQARGGHLEYSVHVSAAAGGGSTMVTERMGIPVDASRPAGVWYHMIRTHTLIVPASCYVRVNTGSSSAGEVFVNDPTLRWQALT